MKSTEGHFLWPFQGPEESEPPQEIWESFTLAGGGGGGDPGWSLPTLVGDLGWSYPSLEHWFSKLISKGETLSQK